MLSQVTDRGLAYLGTGRSLESVLIDSCVNVTMHGLKELAHAPSLKRIEISGQLATTDVASSLIREKSTLDVVLRRV